MDCEVVFGDYFEMNVSQLIEQVTLHFSVRELTHSSLGQTSLTSPPPFIQDYPPNLSISISGGKETNWDTLSNGE